MVVVVVVVVVVAAAMTIVLACLRWASDLGVYDYHEFTG